MTNAILTHDAGVSAFDGARGVVSTDDDEVSFNWDEKHIVTVDAPADLEGAFDTDRFYKIEGATIARPIKQTYVVGDSVKHYKKPADALRRAAWSFDNAPFTLGHPDSGMVKNVDDIHGFWRDARYDSDEDRLKEDLYIPANDDEALEWIEKHQDVSVGFYNRVAEQFDGDTGDLTDDDVDGFQVQLYGDHIAGVKRGRCSSEEGCGLDGSPHGKVVADATTLFESERNMTEGGEMFSEGDRVRWDADAVVAHNPDDESGVMIEILDRDGNSTEMVTTVDERSLMHTMNDSTDSCPCDVTSDAPSGLYEEDGTWYGIAPSETADDEPKYELDNCNDVKDAWNLRGSGDYSVEQSTLEARIKRAADSHDCPPEQKPWESDTNMDNDDDFDIPDLSVDALADKNDSVSDLKAKRDSLEQTVDEMRGDLKAALDSPDNLSVEVDEDECICEGVAALAEAADEAAEEAAKVEELQDELKEYREDERTDALETLSELGANTDKFEDENLDALEEEIQRRKEVLDAAPDVTVKDIDSSTDSNSTKNKKSHSGPRKFGRGHGA